jgi:hypothetical protein
MVQNSIILKTMLLISKIDRYKITIPKTSMLSLKQCMQRKISRQKEKKKMRVKSSN